MSKPIYYVVTKDDKLMVGIHYPASGLVNRDMARYVASGYEVIKLGSDSFARFSNEDIPPLKFMFHELEKAHKIASIVGGSVSRW